MASSKEGNEVRTGAKSHHLIIGCVGKPSAGKSTFLNAATEVVAKTGNFPFTTLEPCLGLGYYSQLCVCTKYEKSSLCKPRYGSCTAGNRLVPVKIIDTPGLIPGANSGLGLGNKFLDHMRTASILLHIVDVSGLTNEKGESTKGYDPGSFYHFIILLYMFFKNIDYKLTHF